jgi:tRNA U34 5-carboxymethylaminomethyl modifying GTPase MnmE/TrmE
LLVGTSGSGKSSLVNYLAGDVQAAVSDSGHSCTKDNMSFEVTLRDKKLRIFDTQGFNDTDSGFAKGNGNVASKIKF